MGDRSQIEWTDSTWNPVTGCTKVSEGCHHCYAERVFQRVYPGRAFTDVQVHPERMDQPFRWKRPRMIFVNSMSDLFHESLPRKFIGEIFATIAACPQHIFQVLTKRPERMREAMESIGEAIRAYDARADDLVPETPPWPIPNLWLGVSVENQATADERIPILMKTSGAAVRFVSYEPALGPVDFGRWIHDIPPSGDSRTGHDGGLFTQIDWVIAGGESGPKARPSHPQWFRDMRDQCAAAGVSFFMKQWGEWAEIPDTGLPYFRPKIQTKSWVTPVPGGRRHPELGYSPGWVGGLVIQFSTNQDWINANVQMMRIGKKAAGRLLDGVEHNEMPPCSG